MHHSKKSSSLQSTSQQKRKKGFSFSKDNKAVVAYRLERRKSCCGGDNQVEVEVFFFLLCRIGKYKNIIIEQLVYHTLSVAACYWYTLQLYRSVTEFTARNKLMKHQRLHYILYIMDSKHLTKQLRNRVNWWLTTR